MAQRRWLPLIAALALAGCGGGAKHEQTAAAAAGGCRNVTPPAPAVRHAPRPRRALDLSRTYDVTLRTNCGSLTIRLAVRTSPHVTASFVDLVRRGFFDGTVFHRIVPGFVIQGGDPTATGTGGPGYTTVDPPPASTRYTPGVVAMAKTQAQAPGTSGSQFFVVSGAAAASLTPDYAVLGRVVRGMDVVHRIGRLGDPQSEQPTRTVEIERAAVTVR